MCCVVSEFAIIATTRLRKPYHIALEASNATGFTPRYLWHILGIMFVRLGLVLRVVLMGISLLPLRLQSRHRGRLIGHGLRRGSAWIIVVDRGSNIVGESSILGGVFELNLTRASLRARRMTPLGEDRDRMRDDHEGLRTPTAGIPRGSRLPSCTCSPRTDPAGSRRSPADRSDTSAGGRPCYSWRAACPGHR